jgi:hypothetical protein
MESIIKELKSTDCGIEDLKEATCQTPRKFVWITKKLAMQSEKRGISNELQE